MGPQSAGWSGVRVYRSSLFCSLLSSWCLLPSVPFFLLPSSSILAHLGSILDHLGSILTPQPHPPKLLRKSMKKGTNERRRKPSMWSILWRKLNYILEGSFWPRVQLFKRAKIAVQLFKRVRMRVLIKNRGPQSKKVNKRQNRAPTVEPLWGEKIK